MSYDLISFFLIDCDDSPSKFTSAQAEIQAFFHKLPIPSQVHRVRTKTDLVNAIRRSRDRQSEVSSEAEVLFAIADCPVRFPLTQLLMEATAPDRARRILLFHQPGWKTTPPKEDFEALAFSLLNPPKTSDPIDCFPPLILGPLTMLEESFQRLKFHPFWMRAGIQLRGRQSNAPWAHQQLTHPAPSLSTSSGWLFKFQMWLQLQLLLARHRGEKEIESPPRPASY